MAEQDQDPPVFDLDALDREGDEPEPLTVHLGGEYFTLKSPGEVPWQKSMFYEQLDPKNTKLEDIEDMLATVMGAEQYQRFREHDLSARQFYALMDKYQQHYATPDEGEADASSTSSNGTARRSKRTSRTKG